MKPLLSILIPTVVGREAEMNRLYDKLYHLCGSDFEVTQEGFFDLSFRLWAAHSPKSNVEILVISDNKEATIGEKREHLYSHASGWYSWQIDDDDLVSDDAISLILEAIKQEPDCVTFRENCMMDGVYKRSNHSLIYNKWQDNFDGFDYTRSPFYKNVIKTNIARSVPFEYVRYNEDERWSMALYPHLANEIHIDEEIYFYQYNSTPHNERYGINR